MQREAVMEFSGIKMFPISELGLSQIYLNEGKTAAIEKWFDADNMDIFEPLPVHDFGNGRYTLTDGHSRCYVAWKAGLSHVPVVYDTDDIVAGEVGKKLYLSEIVWCERFQIKNIAHLQDRILNPEQYEKLWIERCDRGYYLITQTSETERDLLQSKVPTLFLYGASEDLKVLYFENSDGKLFKYSEGLLIAE